MVCREEWNEREEAQNESKMGSSHDDRNKRLYCIEFECATERTVADVIVRLVELRMTKGLTLRGRREEAGDTTS